MAGKPTTNANTYLAFDVDSNSIPTRVKSAFLPIATTAALGGVRPDGSTITIDVNGIISAPQAGTGTVTTVTSAVSGFSFGANPNTTPALTIQNASSPTTQFLRGDGTWASLGLGSSLFSATGVPTTVANARSGDWYLQLGDTGTQQPWYGVLSGYKYDGTNWNPYVFAGTAIGQAVPTNPLVGTFTQLSNFGIYWQHDGGTPPRFVSLWRREAINGVAADYVQYFPPTLDTVVGSAGLASSGTTTKRITVGVIQIAGNGTTDSKLDIVSSSVGDYQSIVIGNITAGSDMIFQELMPVTGTVANKYRFTARGQVTPIPAVGQDFVIDIGYNTRVVRLFAESGFLSPATGGNGNTADPAITVQLENPLNFNTSRMGGVNASENDVLSYNGSTWVPRTISAGGSSIAVNGNVVPPTGNTVNFQNNTGVQFNRVLFSNPSTNSVVAQVDSQAPGVFNRLTINEPVGSFGISHNYPNSATSSYGVVWPGSQGAADAFLKNDGSGNLSWVPAVTSAQVSGQAALTGAVTFAAGSNITMTQTGNTITIASTGGGGGGFSSVSAVWTGGTATKNAYISTNPNVVNTVGITITMVAQTNPGVLANASIRLNGFLLTNTYVIASAFPNYTITIPAGDLNGLAAETASIVTIGITIGTQFSLNANNLFNSQPQAFTTTLSGFYNAAMLPFYTTTATLNYVYTNTVGTITGFNGVLTPGGNANAASGSFADVSITGSVISGQATGTGLNGAGQSVVNLSGNVLGVPTYTPAFYALTSTSTPPSFNTGSSQTTGAAAGSLITYQTASATTDYVWIATALPLARIQYVTALGNVAFVPDVTAPVQTISGQTFNVFGATRLSTNNSVQLFITAS